MKPCQYRTSPEDKPRVSLAMSDWNTGRHLTPQCNVKSWFWVQFPNCTSEQGPVCHLMATPKHEQGDLFNFFLNCPVSLMPNSLSFIYRFDFNTSNKLLSFSTLPCFEFINNLWLSDLLPQSCPFLLGEIPLS